jgi:hypothetical protein
MSHTPARAIVAALSGLFAVAAVTAPPASVAGDEGPPYTLRGHALENLVAFTRLLGYVRCFDPADTAAVTDWGAFAIAAVDKVEGARGPEELASVLQRLFVPLDPAICIGTQPVTLDTLALRDGGAPSGILTWAHRGWAPASLDTTVYWSRRDRHGPDSDALRPGPKRAITADLGGGVWCAVPTSLWFDAAGTLPRARMSRWRAGKPSPRFVPSGDDRSTRLADVALCWTILQHFFPYFDVVHADWDAALLEALQSAAVDSGAEDFGVTLERMLAHLDDGHANVSGPGTGERFYDPASFLWRWVEGRLVVTAVVDPARTALRPGDEVLTVNGEPVERRYAALAPRISAATEGFRRFKSLGMMSGSADTLALEVQGADGARRRALFRVSRMGSSSWRAAGWTRYPGRPAPIAQVRPGIWYVDVARTTDSTFAAMVDTLARARGVIFNVRGYPYHLGIEPLAHLTDTTMTSAQWHHPIVTAPDHRDMTFDFSNWTVSPLAPRFRGRIAFLIDGRAISYAEVWLGIVDHYRLGALVGEPTAGTNGNVNFISLPGGYLVTYTGMKVLKHDGSRHHGVGIRPTVPVSPSLAGIRAGRDEQLERAIEVVGG